MKIRLSVQLLLVASLVAFSSVGRTKEPHFDEADLVSEGSMIYCILHPCNTVAGEGIIFTRATKIAMRNLFTNDGKPAAMVQVNGYIPIKGSVGLYSLGKTFDAIGERDGVLKGEKGYYMLVAYNGRDYKVTLDEDYLYLVSQDIQKYLLDSGIPGNIKEELRNLAEMQGRTDYNNKPIRLEPNLPLARKLAQDDNTRKLAEQGDAKAQYELGIMYENGKGVQKDNKKSLMWLKKSADQGYTDALFSLGFMYENDQPVSQVSEEALKKLIEAVMLGDPFIFAVLEGGAKRGLAPAQYSLGQIYKHVKGAQQDNKKSLMWLKKAAEQGYPPAECALGGMYYGDQAIDWDPIQAINWYTKAAEKGDSMAQLNLGIMYFKGDGAPQDYIKAARWWLKAAEQGDSDAQNNLGGMYAKGLGVKQSYSDARKWWEKAAKQGHISAKKNLALIAEQ